MIRAASQLKPKRRSEAKIAAPSDCVFWLGKQVKDDGSVLFINSRAKIRSRALGELPG